MRLIFLQKNQTHRPPKGLFKLHFLTWFSWVQLLTVSILGIILNFIEAVEPFFHPEAIVHATHVMPNFAPQTTESIEKKMEKSEIYHLKSIYTRQI
jgi:hypothetical protein